MATLKILERANAIHWDYDREADVLYLSVGEPSEALGVDVGDGLVARYDEKRAELVGLTVVGLRARLEKQLGAATGR